MRVFLKILFTLLLIFVPFAFATAEPWAFSVLQATLALMWGLFCFTHKTSLGYTKLLATALLTLAALIILALIQSCWGSTLLQTAPWHPVSLMPLYTLEVASMLATYWVVVCLTSVLFEQQKEVKFLLGSIVCIGASVALCSWLLPNGQYIFQLVQVRGGIGPFLNRNHASLYFALSAIISLGLFFTSFVHKYSTNIGRPVRVSPTAFIWGTLFLFLTISTVMTRSRGGMLALLSGLFIFSFLYFATLSHAPSKRLRGLCLTAALLVATCLWIGTHIAHINVFTQRTDHVSTQVRHMLYQAGTQVLKHYPLWGIGQGALPVVIPAYSAYPLEQYVEHLHNDWLELLISIGLVGSFPIIAGLFYFAWVAIRRLKRLPNTKRPLFTALLAALAAMSVASVVDFHFFIPANALLFFTFVGLLSAPTYDKHRVRFLSVSPVIKGAIVLLFLCALYIPTLKTLAWRSVLFSYGLKTPAKLQLYRQALSYYPSPRFALRLGNACWKASLRAPTAPERDALRQEAHLVARTYLRRYPKEPELSSLYVRTRMN